MSCIIFILPRDKYTNQLLRQDEKQPGNGEPFPGCWLFPSYTAGWALPCSSQALMIVSWCCCRLVGGFSGKEIAEILGRPGGTLRSRLHRTLKKLRTTLSDIETKETP